MHPNIWFPSAIAVVIFFKKTQAIPSPRQYPSASSSNGLHCPVGLRKVAPAKFWNQSGLVMVDTPPTNAALHSPVRMALHPIWIATPEDEQAVSTVIPGPVQPK